ncbi:MAG TPA: GMC family oxidoreductase [Spirochaetota bacterium]|nr:GMC family oxidoreductase [Spirochaetota bacterium]HPN11273.1 GMC family oxidoreductase [Spirochaetota bacterium]
MMNLDNQHFDVIVVGTGPGGATVAKELSAKGKRVLMLEWGPGDPVKGNFRQYFFEQLVPGKCMLITNQFLGMVRGITTGGSSLFYYGTAFPVPHKMLAKHGIDVAAEEKEARQELPIAPLKDEMVTPMARTIMNAARDLGYDWKKLDKFMYQDRWQPDYKFGYYGDPHRVKWSARMYVEEAVSNGALLINRAKVRNVIFNGNRAVGVVVKIKRKTHEIFAPKIVLAAGGIGSAVILRASGIKEAGYHFFYDPLISVCGSVKSPRKKISEIPMTTGCLMADEGYVMTDMALPTMIDKMFALEVFRFWRLFRARKTLRIMIKAKDDLAGRLTNSGGVRKALTKNDKAKLLKGYERAKEILKKAGAKGIYKTWYLAAHPGGTVKIGQILDPDLKVKKYENLFVCDCSVIPEPWGLPPALTIICLGKRLAKHLLSGKQSVPARIAKRIKEKLRN